MESHLGQGYTSNCIKISIIIHTPMQYHFHMRTILPQFHSGHRLHENEGSYFLPQQMRTTQNNENGQVGKRLQLQCVRGTGVLLISAALLNVSNRCYKQTHSARAKLKSNTSVGSVHLKEDRLTDSMREANHCESRKNNHSAYWKRVFIPFSGSSVPDSDEMTKAKITWWHCFVFVAPNGA